MRSRTHALALVVVPAVVSLLAGGACSSSDNDKHDSGTDSPPMATGGQRAMGGAGATATGGNVGSGGRATGGAGAGGALGSGGVPGVGGGIPSIDGGMGTGGLVGTGGRATGGAVGSGGALAIDAARPDGTADRGTVDVSPPPDARPETGPEAAVDLGADVGQPDGPPDAPMNADGALPDVGSATTLESCFAGLPAQVGAQMIATKSTADGRVRMRIALDTEDRGGTSGTYGWGLIRLAVEVDGVVSCMADRSALSYKPSHHNCNDTATGSSGTTTYAITAPDRPTATLTIESNGVTAGPYTLDDTACAMWWSAGAQITCRSGQPC